MKRRIKKPAQPQASQDETALQSIIINVALLFLSIIIIYLMYSIGVSLFTTPPPTQQVAEVVPVFKVQVEVLNGCGVSGVGEQTTEYLRDAGFDVIKTGNYISFDMNNTLVISRTGEMEKARRVAHSLGAGPDAVIEQTNPEYYLDVSVIVGKDFFSLDPYKRENN